ncbi:MAG: hemerythrin domain-containing protein [Planctomycetota bacterium]
MPDSFLRTYALDQKDETAHPIIDMQHRAIYAAASQLARHGIGQIHHHRLLDDFREFKLLSIANFDYEELAMQAIGYPEAAAHIAAHRRIREQMDAVLDQASTFEELMVFIAKLMDNWLPRHVARYDLDLGRALSGS